MARLGPAEPGPLPFRLDGEEYTLMVPEDGLEACGWAVDGNWPALVPGSLDEDSQDRMYGLLTDPYGPLGLRTCMRLVYGLAKPVYGFEWHVVGRLAATAQEHWDTFSAWSVSAGFDPSSAAPHRVCSGVLAWMRAGCQEEKDVRRLESQLYAPPRVAPKRGRKLMPGFSREEQAAAWQKAFAELGGG